MNFLKIPWKFTKMSGIRLDTSSTGKGFFPSGWMDPSAVAVQSLPQSQASAETHLEVLGCFLGAKKYGKKAVGLWCLLGFFVFYMNFNGFWVVFGCCISGDIWFLDCFEMGLRWRWDVFVDGCWLELGENLRNSWKNTKETGAFKDKLQNGEHTKHVNVDGQY